MDDGAARPAVITRLGWIRRQQAKFADEERQSPREYVSRESHYYLGDRYLLNVLYEDREPKVVVRNNRTIDLIVRPDSDEAQRERVLLTWYQAQLKQIKTAWGTWNPKARRIWLHLELIKKPSDCLKYIVVHEMVHLLERTHNGRFVAHMDRFLPR